MAQSSTPAIGWQNKFSTTLSSGITASDTTIPLTSLPTPSEGFLVLEPDSSTGWEVIYYTSKTGSAVVCPSVAAGRGQDDSTAASHSSGATVRMDTTAGMFEVLQNATGLTGVHENNSYYGFDFVASGCVWSGDAYASTRVASMTSGVAYINGRKHTVAAVTSRTFTASKDTYIDLLYSLTDNVATVVYTEASNNAASPALAANSIRIGIIITAAGSIADAGSVNQGQETKVLPIASSTPYTVTDSLGNLICPRDPNRKVLGYRQITANFTTTSATPVIVTGLSFPAIIPTGRKVRVTGYIYTLTDSGSATMGFNIFTGASLNALTTQIQASEATKNGTTLPINVSGLHTPSATTLFFSAAALTSTGTLTVTAAATAPAFIMVELV